MAAQPGRKRLLRDGRLRRRLGEFALGVLLRPHGDRDRRGVGADPPVTWGSVAVHDARWFARQQPDRADTDVDRVRARPTSPRTVAPTTTAFTDAGDDHDDDARPTSRSARVCRSSTSTCCPAATRPPAPTSATGSASPRPTVDDTDAILANAIVHGPVVADILDTDVAFNSSGCGTWSPVLPTGGAGRHVRPGHVRGRLRHRAGHLRGRRWPGLLLAPAGWVQRRLRRAPRHREHEHPGQVVIEETDVGFDSVDCGTWTLVSSRPGK